MLTVKVDSGVKAIKIDGLPPGNYVVDVTAANSKGDSMPAHVSVSIPVPEDTETPAVPVVEVD